MKLLSALFRRLRNRDDFHWPQYTTIYKAALDEEAITLTLPDGKFLIRDGQIILDRDLAPLHPNHKLIYETALRLKPASILEIGCGAGYHLVNLRKLMPDAAVTGCDLLRSQLDLALERYPQLNGTLSVHDITIAPPPVQAEMVFTQTVIMHIQKDHRHIAALRNIFRTATKYVVLMENWSSHNFYSDIATVAKEPTFPWGDLHGCVVDDQQQQLLVVLSPVKLNGLPPLTGNHQLQKYL